MHDWLRSLSVLAGAFAVLIVVTIGLAAFIVPEAAGTGQALGTASPGASVQPGGAPSGPVTAVGGTLAVSGDREGTFVLDREALDQGYALAGEQGQIFFGGDPLAVERVSYDGLEFYVDEGDCSVTPGERHDPTGVAGAQVRCDDIDDIRDGGTVSMEGTVGVSADMLGLRGEMPETGGTVEVGDTTLELPFTVLFVGRPIGFAPAGGFVPTDDGSSWLMFDFDFQTHALVLEIVALDGVEHEIDPGDCTLNTESIGTLNPRTTTAELRIDCPAVELESGETVPIRGTLIADLIENP